MKKLLYIIPAIIIIYLGKQYFFDTKQIQLNKEALEVTATITKFAKASNSISISGSLESFQTVSIKSRVAGTLNKIYFKEGDEVKEGELLFEIDNRGFQNQLTQAEATLERDTAQLEYNKKLEERYKKLLKQGFITQESYDNIQTTVNNLLSAIESDLAEIENAKLQIQYSKITAPITGITGVINLQEGNLIKAEDTNPLVVINKIKPIYATFQMPDENFEYLKELEKNQKPISLETENKKIIENGKIVFIDNQINNGTIKVKALFENSEQILWPGQFVRVICELYEKDNVISLPSHAVLTNNEGKYVYIVNDKNQAEIRHVKVAFIDNGKAIIDSGLAENEKVITNNYIKIKPMMQVNAVINSEK